MARQRPKLYLVSRWYGPGEHDVIGVFDPTGPTSSVDPTPMRRRFRGKLIWEVDCRAWRAEMSLIGRPLRRKFKTEKRAAEWCVRVVAEYAIAIVSRQVSRPRTRRAANRDARLTNRMRYKVLRRDNFHCMACGATGKEAVLVVDHIMPVSKGGKSTMSNLQTLCFTCNSGKGNMDP